MRISYLLVSQIRAKRWHLKSDNLQYNMLDCWVDGTKDSASKRLMFQALFFSKFLIDLGHSKLFNKKNLSQ